MYPSGPEGYEEFQQEQDAQAQFEHEQSCAGAAEAEAEAAQAEAEQAQTSNNNRSDEIAFLESLQQCYFDTKCIDWSSVGYKMLNERIAQLRAVR